MVSERAMKSSPQACNFTVPLLFYVTVQLAVYYGSYTSLMPEVGHQYCFIYTFNACADGFENWLWNVANNMVL